MMNTETSSLLFEAIDFGAILKPKHLCNGSMRVQFEYLESGYDGIFPTKASWTRYSNSVVRDGGSYILSRILGGIKKLKTDDGQMTIEREKWWQDSCTITFKRPIKMVVGGYRNRSGEWQDIIEEIDYLVGEINHDWLFQRGDLSASAIEIYLDIKDYGKAQVVPA